MAFYVVDGLNICREDYPTRLTGLLTLLLELKNEGHDFICFFDQDAFGIFAKGKPYGDVEGKTYREMTDSRQPYNQFFKQIRGKADKKILELANNNPDYVVLSNDAYKNFRPSYPWLGNNGRYISGISVFAGQIVCEPLNLAVSENTNLADLWKALRGLLDKPRVTSKGQKRHAGAVKDPTQEETAKMRKKCPTCGKIFEEYMRFCQSDGTPLLETYDTNKSPEEPEGRSPKHNAGNSGSDVIQELLDSETITEEVAEVLRFGIEEKPTQILTDHTEMVALVIVMDKSGSMSEWKQAVIDGQRHMLNALLGASVSAYDIRLAQILFNHEVDYFQRFSKFRDDMNPRKTHPDVKVLDDRNYRPSGFTALYDAILQGICALTPLILSATEEGISLETRVGILTDGMDEGEIGPGSKIPPEALRKAIDFMVSEGLLNKITMVGIGDFDYARVGREIGIDNVISFSADPKNIRRAFELFSSQ